MITIPTLVQLYNGILADLEAEFGTNIPLFGKNFLRAKAAVQAGKLKLIYLSLGNVQKNIFADTADPESKGGTLERFGRVKLGRNPFAARAGQYELEVTGTIGSIIKASSTFKSNDDSLSPGKLYVLDTAFELTAEIDYITVRALESGLDSSLNINDELTATAPIAGVTSLASVSAEIIEPLSAEGTEEYRGKTMNSFRLEAQGGAPTDFRLWAQDAQGVAAVYPYAKSGASGEVNLYIEATLADSDDGKGTPSAMMIAEVEEVIDFNPDSTLPLLERGRRPMGVYQVHYLPVTIKDINIEITGFVGATVAIETAIFNAVATELANIRPFVSGADILDDKNDILDINKIISLILLVRPGSVFTSVDLKVDDVSESTWTFTNGDIPFLNTITYVS